jgi:hypothetical protein
MKGVGWEEEECETICDDGGMKEKIFTFYDSCRDFLFPARSLVVSNHQFSIMIQHVCARRDGGGDH